MLYFGMLAIFVAVSVLGVPLTHVGVSLLAPLKLFSQSVPVRGVEPFVFTISSWAYGRGHDGDNHRVKDSRRSPWRVET